MLEVWEENSLRHHRPDYLKETVVLNLIVLEGKGSYGVVYCVRHRSCYHEFTVERLSFFPGEVVSTEL